MNSEKREEMIDILKGLAIFSVVIGHAFNTSNHPSVSAEMVRRFVYVYHLPIFFFCTGYLHKTKPFAVLFKRTILNNYIKFVVVSITSYILLPFWLNKGAILEFSNHSLIKGILKIILFRPAGVFVSAIWFVPFYCVSVLIFHSLMQIKIRTCILGYITVIIAGIAGLFLTKLGIRLYDIDIALCMQPIMLLGLLYREKKELIILKKWNSTLLFAILYMFLILILNYFTSGEIELSKRMVYYGIGFYPVIILGILFLIFSAEVLKTTKIGKILAIAGKNSFAIMAYHFIIFKLIDVIAVDFFKYPKESMALFPYSFSELRVTYILLGAIIPIGLSILVNWFVKKLILLIQNNS